MTRSRMESVYSPVITQTDSFTKLEGSPSVVATSCGSVYSEEAPSPKRVLGKIRTEVKEDKKKK